MNFLKKIFKQNTHCNLDITCSHCDSHNQMKTCGNCGEKNICKPCYKDNKLCIFCDEEYNNWAKNVCSILNKQEKLQKYSLGNKNNRLAGSLL